MSNSDLTYVINKPRGVITLDLFEDEAGLNYQFAGNDPHWQNVRSSAYDLRFRATSIGGR